MVCAGAFARRGLYQYSKGSRHKLLEDIAARSTAGVGLFLLALAIVWLVGLLYVTTPSGAIIGADALFGYLVLGLLVYGCLVLLISVAYGGLSPKEYSEEVSDE